MTRVEITTEVIELVVNGQEFLMQADPSADPLWDKLMELSLNYKNDEERHQARADFTEVMVGLSQDTATAEAWTEAGFGYVTLQKAAKAYVQAVTGFPTQPSSTSKQPSKQTSRT